MAKQIQFTGINRAVSDYSNTGACEELINLRPTNTGLVPVKGFSKKMEGITFNKLYEHNVGSQVNYIGVTFANDGSSLSVDRVSESGEVLSNLITLQTPPSFSADSIHVATTGNILTISISDEATKLYVNYAFRWRNNAYEPLEANVPSITPTITLGTPTKQFHRTANYFINIAFDTGIDSAKDYISTAFSAIQKKNPTYCFGPCIMAIAFKTIDGDTFWTGQWYPINPVQDVNYSLSGASDYYHFTSSASYASSFPDTLAVNGSAYLAAYLDDNSNVNHRLAGCTVTVSIPAISGWNKNTSILKAVEIYVSRPAIYQDYSFSKANPELATVNSTMNLALPELPVKEMNLGGQLLYLQKSINLEELTSSQTINLRFGGEIQVTDKTLEVDPGMITRTGKMLSYNNRYHFYDSVKRTYLGVPKFANRRSGTATSTDVFVTYESDTIKTQVYVGTANIVKTGGNATAVWNLVTAPTLNIRTVTILYQAQGYYFIRDYAMNESSAYNYSICDSGGFSRQRQTADASDSEVVKLLALKAAGAVTYIDEKEATAINVSEQYNPFVFRVKHSYLAPAAVLDLQPQLMAVADISIGSAPLDVFTSQGVYALLQGDGEVLYSAFHALSNLISERNSASTDAGTFFIASGNLWRIAGLHSELVSDALSLGPHKEIRSCSSYQSLSNNAVNTYDVQPYESDPIFENYSKGASLVYNRFRDELIVSNPSYDYSYVLSLKYRQWFKIPYTYSQEIVGSDLATLSAGTKVLTGTSASVMIQSWYASEGATVDYDIWVNDRTYIEFQTHTATAAEDAADTSAHAPQLLAEHLVSEWNALIAASHLPLTASVDTTYTANHIRFINITFTGRVDDVKSIDSHLSAALESQSMSASQWPVFKTPHDIYDFSDEIESETAYLIPAGASGEVKISHFESYEGGDVEIIIAFDGATEVFNHTITEEEANSHPEEALIPHLIAELSSSEFIEDLGMVVTAGTTSEYVDLIFTTSTALADPSGEGMNIEMTIHEISTDDTIASSPAQIPVALTVHLQSRPISFGYAYTHIHRVVDMVRSTLRSANNLTVALYGSDDLHTWSLLSYANRSGNAAGLSVSQLRTPSTARAWRYYTITIGGIIPVDTDFGPVLLDEAPVVRRIG